VSAATIRGGTPELTLVLFDRGNQESAILWTFGEHFVVRDDLVLGFPHFNDVPELVWLASLGVRLEKTHDLMRILGNSSKHPRPGLAHHLSHTPGYRFQGPPETLQPCLLVLRRRCISSNTPSA
jgi:hypothetical protein